MNPEEEKTNASNSQEEQIKQLQQQCQEYKSDLQRLAAEFDNYKKRVNKELDLAYKKGQEDVLLNLLDIYEEILISLEPANQSTDPKVIKDGLKLLQKKLSNFFSYYKIQEIDCSGEPDPHLHEVILRIEGEPDGKIAQIIKKGYVRDGKLLKAAKVSIYKKSLKSTNKEDKEENQNNQNSSSAQQKDKEEKIKKEINSEFNANKEKN
ncbi:MAG: nucleotide exchange factor GrpE [Candidatus Micrarchaeota archaeon]|nr:nucleotide exchange factor GrpE [Candidatus Micrarchaeota archaeon]